MGRRAGSGTDAASGVAQVQAGHLGGRIADLEGALRREMRDGLRILAQHGGFASGDVPRAVDAVPDQGEYARQDARDEPEHIHDHDGDVELPAPGIGVSPLRIEDVAASQG
mgnify:CR=1 FL=1